MKTYSELVKLNTLEERFKYLKLNGRIGEDTFGFDRYINQLFYSSSEWRAIRDQVIIRDNGNDMGLDGHEISGIVIIHHMNPITKKDIQNRNPDILNPEFLISVSDRTHKAIHYGGMELLSIRPIIRSKFDTCPWRH